MTVREAIVNDNKSHSENKTKFRQSSITDAPDK